MTWTRHTREQIIAVLKAAPTGVTVQDLWRKCRISDATHDGYREDRRNYDHVPAI